MPLRFCVETFLLRTLESLSRYDLQRVLEDTRLAGKNIVELRSIWNELKPEHYQSLIQSFFHHMRFEKRNGIRSMLRQCLDGRSRHAESVDRGDVEGGAIPIPIEYSSEIKKPMLTKTSHHPLVTPLETLPAVEMDHDTRCNSPGDTSKKNTSIGGAASVASV
jgi:hypothetical protein